MAGKQIAWVHNAIRPYESLVIILHRFLYLNRPRLQDFARDYLVNGRWWGGSGTASLIYGERIFSDGQCRPFLEIERLARRLGIQRASLRFATTSMLRGTPVDHVELNFRFCSQCMRLAYHSVLFQLSAVRKCPIHDAALTDRCENCGSTIDLSLTVQSFKYPFACPRCWKLLIDSDALFQKPVFRGAEKIKPIVNFYWKLAQVDTQFPSSSDNPRAADAALAATCLSRAAGIRAPVELKRIVTTPCPVTITNWRYFGPGNRNAVPSNSGEPFDPPNMSRSRRFTLIYKSYRRYLQKTHIGTKRWILRRCALGADAIDAMRALDPVITRYAYAILLWRNRIEERGSIYSGYWWDRDRSQWSYIHFSIDPFFRHFRIEGQSRIADTEEEQRWINNHFFAEELRSYFQEAVSLANRMMEVGRYFLGANIFTRVGKPYCLAIRKRRFDAIEFFSWSADLENLARQRVDDMVAVEDRRAEARIELMATVAREMHCPCPVSA